MKKILISADPNGRLEQLFAKANQLHAKNRFDFMLMLGKVCSLESAVFMKKLSEKSSAIGLPTYFIDDSEMSRVLQLSHPNGSTLAPNFNFLGAAGVTKIQGIRIAFLNGSQRDNSEPSDNMIEQLIESCQKQPVDLLLTNDWPLEMQTMAGSRNYPTTHQLSRLAMLCSPKYHLAANGNTFCRLETFASRNGHSTHFICVAPFVENSKDKYLFAIQTAPLGSYPDQPPKNSSPYSQITVQTVDSEKGVEGTPRMSLKTQKSLDFSNKAEDIKENTFVRFEGVPAQAREADLSEFMERWGQITRIEFTESKGDKKSGFVKFASVESTRQCILDSMKFSLHGQRIRLSGRSVELKYRVEECWFCISKANFDKSLLVHEGKYCYITLEKSPLTEHHLQIIPYNHVESTGRLDSVEYQELTSCVDRLREHFIDNLHLQVLVYERCIKLSSTINHCVVHLIPTPCKDLLSKFSLLNIDDHLQFAEVKESHPRNTEHYIEVSINHKHYIKPIPRKEKVQSDFMRKVVCELLGKHQLSDWQQAERPLPALHAAQTATRLIIAECGLAFTAEQP